MSRPIGYGADEAKSNFKKELEKCMIDIGLRSKKDLAARMNMAYRTMYHRFEDIDDMRVSDLAGLVKILRPNPLLLLRLVGYSTKDIKNALDKC